MSSWGTQKEPGNPKLIEWFLKPLIMAGFIHDMALMEKILMETKLNYTVVRPPGLTNGELNYLEQILSENVDYTISKIFLPN